MAIHQVAVLTLGLELILCTLVATASLRPLIAAQSPNESPRR